jgi:hypothetical protein
VNAIASETTKNEMLATKSKVATFPTIIAIVAYNPTETIVPATIPTAPLTNATVKEIAIAFDANNFNEPFLIVFTLCVFLLYGSIIESIIKKVKNLFSIKSITWNFFSFIFEVKTSEMGNLNRIKHLALG